ncbi:MAG: L,D-transpeptidase [Gemmatimonadaceae bacterium]
MRRVLMCAVTGLIGVQQMRIAVNIPAYRLDVYVADSLVRSMKIAPGMPAYPTPRGTFAITSIEWNPWWIPPNSPWAAKEHTMRPGPANPMGRVKLNFRPLYFLHGTPLAASIGSAASHGCIRLRSADAIDLARLVHGFGSPELTADDIDRLATDTATTRLLVLDRSVPLEIRYELAEVRAGRLTVYRDVYGLAAHSPSNRVYEALAANGVDTTLVDSSRIRALLRRIAPAGTTIAIDSLLRRPPASMTSVSVARSSNQSSVRAWVTTKL